MALRSAQRFVDISLRSWKIEVLVKDLVGVFAEATWTHVFVKEELGSLALTQGSSSKALLATMATGTTWVLTQAAMLKVRGTLSLWELERGISHKPTSS